MSSSSSKQLDIHFDDPNTRNWCHPLKEDVFAAFMSKENPIKQRIFGAGSLFNPFLFGKFFDPSDAFPLWEFESDAFSFINNNSNMKHSVDWLQNDNDYVLRAEILGLDYTTLQVCVENGNVLEISGQWRRQIREDWKSSDWWEHGYVRRIELPEKIDGKKSEAHVKNDTLLEIRIPKNHNFCTQGVDRP